MNDTATESITQKENPKFTQLLDVLRWQAQALKCELVSSDPPVLVIDFDQEAIWAVLPYLDGSYNTLPGSNEPLIKWRVKNLYSAGLIEIEDCAELSHEGDSVLLVPRKAYKGDHRIQRKDAVIRENVRPYLAPEATSEHRFAAEALCGEIPFVTPVLAGLKPVAFYSCGLDVPQEELEPQLRKIMAKDPDHFFVKEIKDPYLTEAKQIFLFYNPVTVRNCLRKHASLFASFGFTEESPPEQVVNFFVEQTSPELEREDANRMHALGLLLGYDEKSSRDFAIQALFSKREGESFSQKLGQVLRDLRTLLGHIADGFILSYFASTYTKSLPLWGVNYHVSDANRNADFNDLYESYESLRRWIERELSKGQKPSEVFDSLPLYSSSDETKKSVAKAII
ncbi:hypothetical protein IPG41_07010 [Candidatus Peregrinibacteria bacterium]|nr:MAG: hypothetical protein IPG41_07010 [Candidatus Peregrinibacteria bacterium]